MSFSVVDCPIAPGGGPEQVQDVKDQVCVGQSGKLGTKEQIVFPNSGCVSIERSIRLKVKITVSILAKLLKLFSHLLHFTAPRMHLRVMIITAHYSR